MIARQPNRVALRQAAEPMPARRCVLQNPKQTDKHRHRNKGWNERRITGQGTAQAGSDNDRDDDVERVLLAERAPAEKPDQYQSEDENEHRPNAHLPPQDVAFVADQLGPAHFGYLPGPARTSTNALLPASSKVGFTRGTSRTR